MAFSETLLLHHPECVKHEMGRSHPEQPARLVQAEKYLRDLGVWTKCLVEEAPLASFENIALAHPAEYITRIEKLAPHSGYVMLDADTSMNAHSWPAIQHAAGAAVRAVDFVMSGESKRAFGLIRPPGHHAEYSRAMGFCFFNNIAIAAAYALDHYQLKRVAIVDFDVHHGNGTEDIFKNDKRVLFVSTFQHPFYPGTSLGQLGQNPHIIKTPMARGDGSREFRNIVQKVWLSELENFKPELLLISAGFDAHQDDMMAGLEFVDDDYAWVTRELVQFANAHCQGRVVSMLEGGYELSALARCIALHIGEML